MGVTDDEFAMVLVDAQEKLRWVPKSILLAQMGVPKAKRNDYLDANRELVELPRYRLAGRVVTDRMFKVNLLRIAEKRAAAPTWVYRFAWPSGAFGFAEHCLDVPFFFDCLDAPAVEALAGANPPQVIADELHADAVNYVRSGDPGWPRFGPPKYVVRVFDLPTRDVPDGLESVYPLLEATV